MLVISSVPVGLVCCIFLSFLWLSPTVMNQPTDNGYPVSVLLFCIGTLIELLTEPLVVLGQAHQYVTTKVWGWGKCYMPHYMHCLTKVLVEGASQLSKCFFTVVMVMWFPQWGMTALSVANVCTIPITLLTI